MGRIVVVDGQEYPVVHQETAMGIIEGILLRDSQLSSQYGGASPLARKLKEAVDFLSERGIETVFYLRERQW